MRRSSVSNAMSSMTLTQAASTVSRSICASLAPVLHIAPNRVLKKSWVLMAGSPLSAWSKFIVCPFRRRA